MRRAKLERRAKVVATLGPVTSDVEMISNLILGGMNVARVNMSHGTREAHAEVIANIRKASRAVGLEVAVLMDLQGPKIRVDKVPAGLALKKGDVWVIGPTHDREEYPIETVKMMGKIIGEAERTPHERPPLRTVDLARVDVTPVTESDGKMKENRREQRGRNDGAPSRSLTSS